MNSGARYSAVLVTDVELFCGSSPMTMIGVWLASSKDAHPPDPMHCSIERPAKGVRIVRGPRYARRRARLILREALRHRAGDAGVVPTDARQD
jgi:hypothetical protein